MAAPIRKLCPAHCVGSIPADCRALLMWKINLCFVNGVLSLNWNIGPGEFPHVARNGVTAVTGQRSSPVFLTKMCTPLSSQSVLDVLRKILSTVGLRWLSIAISPTGLVFLGTIVGVIGRGQLTHAEKPKETQCTGSIIISSSWALGDHTCLIFLKIAGVIGRRVRFCLGKRACVLLVPLWSIFNFGILLCSSSIPVLAICICRMAAR